jgi:hypothetical protein
MITHATACATPQLSPSRLSLLHVSAACPADVPLLAAGIFPGLIGGDALEADAALDEAVGAYHGPVALAAAQPDRHFGQPLAFHFSHASLEVSASPE